MEEINLEEIIKPFFIKEISEETKEKVYLFLVLNK